MLLTAWSYARFSQNSEKSGSAYSYTAESLGPKSGFCRLVLSTRLSVITTHQCVTGCNLSHRTNSKFALLVLGAGIGRPCDFSQLFPYSITCQFKPRVCVRTHYSHGHFVYLVVRVLALPKVTNMYLPWLPYGMVSNHCYHLLLGPPFYAFHSWVLMRSPPFK